MAERVSEIQYHARAGVALVLHDERALDVAACVDYVLDFRHNALSAAERRKPAEERRVADTAVFYDLRHAVGEGSVAQRFETVRVDEHALRLPEGPGEVLPRFQIYADLAADGRIDLREQRRRNLYEIHAAQDRRRGEAREVSDHAAAERDYGVAAREAEGRHRLPHFDKLFRRLRFLARRHDVQADLIARGFERRDRARAVNPADCLVGDGEDAPRLRHKFAALRGKRAERAAPYLYVVLPSGKSNPQRSAVHLPALLSHSTPSARSAARRGSSEASSASRYSARCFIIRLISFIR